MTSNFITSIDYFSTGQTRQFKCDRLLFDYNWFNIGKDCITLGWNYVGQDCRPVTYELQGYQLVTSNQLDAPNVSIISPSARFTLLVNRTIVGSLYFRAVGIDRNGAICNSDSLINYYHFSRLLENGINFIVAGNTLLYMHATIPNLVMVYFK